MKHLLPWAWFFLFPFVGRLLHAQSVQQVSPLEQSYIDNYLHLLGSEHGDRRNGIERLCQHPAARMELRALARGNYWTLAHEGAIEVLGCLRDPSDVALLDSLLCNAEYPYYMPAIGRALGNHRSAEAIDALLLRSQHSNPQVAMAAILGMGETANESVRPALEGFLTHSDKAYRWVAVVAIGALGADGSKATLEARMSLERDAEVRGRMQKELKTIKAREKMHYHYGGYMERVGDGFRDIDAVGEKVILSFHTFREKPELVEGRRITLLPEVLTAKIGDTIRIFHVYEDQRAESELYIMGPKAITGLVVDSKSSADLGKLGDYPGEIVYDGVVISQPGWDYNFEITKLVFATEGEHTVEWRAFGLSSNVVRIWVGL
jgi:HEAT repeats